MKTEQNRERKRKLIASNRRARHDYEIIQTFEAGVALQGTEVKSLRSGKCSLQDAYSGFKSHTDNEIYIFNLHINPYEHGNIANHEPKRPRKLLLNRREINKLKTAVQEKGLTIVPLQIYFSGHLVKIELALVRAKRKYDKREATKERESEREIRRKFRI
jgi:SsrA-binding protein